MIATCTVRNFSLIDFQIFRLCNQSACVMFFFGGLISIRALAHGSETHLDVGICSLDIISFDISLTTLQGTNISHPGKRKIIFKSALVGGHVRSQEGIFAV